MDKRRKELLFLGAGLAVLLIALYLTLKPSAPAAQATTQPPAGAKAPAATAAAPAATAQIQAAAALVPTSESATSAGRNPFTPVISATRIAPPTMTLTGMAPVPSLPPLRALPITPFGGLGSESAQSAPVIKPVEAPLTLTGVIYGDPSLAIIRKGDKRYYVRPGDPVGNRYVVQSISHRRVVLASSQGTLSLDLTGRL